MKNKSVMPIVLILFSIVLAIVSFIVLPDNIIIQFSLEPPGNSTAPKVLALLLPLALGTGGGVFSIISKEKEQTYKNSIKVSVIGILVGIFMLIINAMA